jgi:sensor histidine kinase regulating citrate/malate metabolism
VKTDILLIVVAILMIIVIGFMIYNKIAKFIEHRLTIFQEDLLAKHYDEVKNIYTNMRGWRHDYHNHIQTIKGHLMLNQLPELNGYLDKLEQDLNTVDTILKTGNVMLDAILNSKLTLANSKQININVSAQVVEKLTVSEIDLCVIIGNLLDNAIEACKAIEKNEERFIRIYIGIIKKQLYISVTNSVGGKIKKVNNEYVSTKDKSDGFGLKRINAIVDKYGGYINRQNEVGVFATEIMLPI